MPLKGARPLVIIAVEAELPAEDVPDWKVEVCGVGKINAALHLSRILHSYRPDYVLNLGTAGGITQNPGTIVEVGGVVQRDMDLSPLGLKKGETAFDRYPACIRLSDSPVICGTGDNFAQEKPDIICDIVDMELFALAKTCLAFDVPLRAFKYISDGADQNANTDWKQALYPASQAFKKLLETQTEFASQ